MLELSLNIFWLEVHDCSLVMKEQLWERITPCFVYLVICQVSSVCTNLQTTSRDCLDLNFYSVIQDMLYAMLFAVLLTEV